MTEAKVTYIDGLRFVASANSGHAVVMDTDPEFGGSNTGSTPMEILLMGLGGCSGMDVISVLKKKKQDVSSFHINIKGDKAENYPKKFTEIDVEFVLKGRNLSHEAVKKAIELSMTKYCSVKAALEGSAKITWSWKIIEE
ncbi:MAG: OsmC family protein [Nitrospiraceae bacterium]|nr:OsmC family protein [Nitrospiraceae bacterium]